MGRICKCVLLQILSYFLFRHIAYHKNACFSIIDQNISTHIPVRLTENGVLQKYTLTECFEELIKLIFDSIHLDGKST